MQAIILAGGKGTQINSLLANTPKPLLPLFDRPVAEHTIKLLAKHGVSDIIITLSRSAKDIVRYFGNGSRFGVNIQYSIEDEPLGTAGALKVLQPMINGTFIVVSGDIVTDFNLTDAIAYHKSASAIATVLLSQAEDPTEFGLVQCEPDGRITRIVEKPKSTEVFTHTVNTGIYILEPEMLSCIPYNNYCDFSRHLFPRMLNNREPVYALALPGYWCDTGNITQYRNVHFDALTKKLKIQLPAIHVGEGVWLGEGVDIHPSVEIKAPLFIGSRTVVKRNVILGERAVLGAGMLVDESASISRSIIGSGTTIGKNAKISDSIISGAYSIFDDQIVSDRAFIGELRREAAIEVSETKRSISETPKEIEVESRLRRAIV